MASTQSEVGTMDWWQRERQRRLNRILLFLLLLLALIGFFYWQYYNGRVGTVGDLDFDTTNHIAFVHQDPTGELILYSVRADGSDLRRLTAKEDRSNKQDPAWTMDGKSLVYASNKTDARVSQVYRLGGGETKQLTYGPGNKYAPTPSPNNQRVAYVTQGAIKTVKLNGSDVLQVLPPPRAGSAPADDAVPTDIEPQGPFVSVAFSSEGTGIAGAQSLSVDDNPVNFGGMNPGEQVARAVPPGGDRALILDTGREVSVTWDPTSPRLACAYTEFETKVNGKTVLVSGVNIYDFTKGPKPEARPLIAAIGYTFLPKNIAWSPDGKRIVLEGWRLKGEGTREPKGITMLDVANAGSIRTKEQADAIPYLIPVTAQGKPQNPRWSPDGTRLYYEMVRPDGRRDIWVINYDGSNPINLTKDLKGDSFQPIWSPVAGK